MAKTYPELIVTCALAISSYGVMAAQVPVQQEPHHRMVFENAVLRVFDVNLEAADTTLDHTHSHDVMTVTLSASETRLRTPGMGWGDVRPRRKLGETNLMEYAGQSGTHALQNVGNSPLSSHCC